MPNIDMTTPGRYWNLHTEELMETAAKDIYHDPVSPHACHLVRMWGLGGLSDPVIQLHVYEPGALVATPDLGTTLVHSAIGWEVLNDEQATDRGIPLPTPEP